MTQLHVIFYKLELELKTPIDRQKVNSWFKVYVTQHAIYCNFLFSKRKNYQLPWLTNALFLTIVFCLKFRFHSTRAFWYSIKIHSYLSISLSIIFNFLKKNTPCYVKMLQWTGIIYLYNSITVKTQFTCCIINTIKIIFTQFVFSFHKKMIRRYKNVMKYIFILHACARITYLYYMRTYLPIAYVVVTSKYTCGVVYAYVVTACACNIKSLLCHRTIRIHVSFVFKLCQTDVFKTRLWLVQNVRTCMYIYCLTQRSDIWSYLSHLLDRYCEIF